MFSNDAKGAVTGSDGGGGGGGAAEVVADGSTPPPPPPPPPLPASDPCGDLERRDQAVGMRWGGSMGSMTVSMDDMAADMLGFCICRIERRIASVPASARQFQVGNRPPGCASDAPPGAGLSVRDHGGVGFPFGGPCFACRWLAGAGLIDKVAE